MAAVSNELEFALADGRIIRLVGLEPPQATAAAPARAATLAAALRARVEGQTVDLVALGGTDRWGTTPGLVFVQGENLTTRLLGDGHVRFQPERLARGCRDTFLAAEASARLARRDVWADPQLQVFVASEAPVDVPDAASDRMVVIEGVVAAVGETATRLYIDLGRRRGGFAISVAKRDTALMESGAIKSARTAGTRVRIRGLAERRTGLRIDVFDADAIELLSSNDAVPQAAGR